MKRWRRGLTLVSVVAALIVVAIVLPLSAWIVTFVDWARAMGVRGAAVYGVVYAVGVVLLVPGSLLTLGAGFLYGPLWGTALVSISSVTGATLAFLVARSPALRWIAERIAKSDRFDAVNRAVGDEGFKVVLLLRLTPVLPFVALNYALGLTRVRLASYVLASFLGMFPATLMYVYLGSLITEVAALTGGAPRDQPWAGQIMLWGGLVATVIVTVFLTRLARRALAERMPAPPAEKTGREEP